MIWRPIRRTHAIICIHFILPKSRTTVLPLIVWVYLHLNLCSRLQKTHLFCNRARFGRSRSSKVDNFATNRKRVYDYILVGHCDYGAILHPFWDTAIYGLKLPIFLSHSAPSLRMFPLEFRDEVNPEETGVVGLSSSEDRMSHFDTVLACDGQTQTGGQI